MPETVKTTAENRTLLFLSRFCTAIRFLTIIPVSWRAADDPHQFARCLLFFPVVGLAIGAVGSFGVYILLLVLPHEVVAVLATVYLGGISGFLHLDGLADSGDGLLSSRPREVCLRIMKDSRTGAMGVVVVVFVLLIKASTLSSMTPRALCLAIFFLPLAGRCAILWSMACLPYARPEGGLGGLFYSNSSRTAAAVALLLFGVLLALLAPSHFFVTAVAILALIYWFGRWCKKQLGGATGDTLGAICELTEAITAIAFTASFPFS